MALEYEADQDILYVKWADDLSVESAMFLQTIISLFTTIHKNKISNLIIDSGIPSGGVLTEEFIHYCIQQIPSIPLKKIALLESPDYHWDNNLYQIIKLLITNHHLPIAVKIAKSRSAAQDWVCRN